MHDCARRHSSYIYKRFHLVYMQSVSKSINQNIAPFVASESETHVLMERGVDIYVKRILIYCHFVYFHLFSTIGLYQQRKRLLSNRPKMPTSPNILRFILLC